MKKFHCGVRLISALLAQGALAGTVVQFQISTGNKPVGTFDLELYDQDKPVTVSNFLDYVQSGAYANSFFHRSVPGFVVQGGGYVCTTPTNTAAITTTNIASIPSFGTIIGEANINTFYSNTNGTIAMALSTGPDSATSEFFFNLADNSSLLDGTLDGGPFTVFGRVINGSKVLNSIAAYPIVNASAAGAAFNTLPVSSGIAGAVVDPPSDSLIYYHIVIVPDTNRPTLSITRPASGLRVSNAAFTVSGTAGDKVAVSNVLVSVNGSGWNPAVSSNNWSSWSSAVTLTPGTNTIAAYSVDTSGNVSLTNTAKVVYILSAPLTVRTNGQGAISPGYNGVSLELGADYSLTARPAAGFSFVNWTDNLGQVLTNGATLRFVMASNLTLAANFRDVTRPTLIIASPTASLHPTNALLTVTGKAADNVAVSNVMVAINGAWVTAVSANHGSNWTAQVALAPGANTVSAYAVDTSGNISLTNSVKLVYILTDRLAVQIVGQGAVSPNDNGKFLVIGNRYTLTASPAKGSVFALWDVGGVMSASPALTFTMSSNLTITASFRDVQRPVNVITFPQVNQKWSNAVITVTGKASDNVGVSNVWWQLNNRGWSNAFSANGFTNWSATNLTVLLGTNLVRAYAVDAAGNVSLTNGVKFTGFPQ